MCVNMLFQELGGCLSGTEGGSDLCCRAVSDWDGCSYVNWIQIPCNGSTLEGYLLLDMSLRA